MEKERGGSLGVEEWNKLFGLLKTNKLADIIKIFKPRDRTTISRAYNVASELFKRGNTIPNVDEIESIANRSRYGTTAKYVSDAILKYKIWLETDEKQKANNIGQPKKCLDAISDAAVRLAKLFERYPRRLGQKTVEEVFKNDKEAMELLRSPEAEWLLSHIKYEKPEWFVHEAWEVKNDPATGKPEIPEEKAINDWLEFTMDDLRFLEVHLVYLLRLRATRKDFQGSCDACADQPKPIFIY